MCAHTCLGEKESKNGGGGGVLHCEPMLVLCMCMCVCVALLLEFLSSLNKEWGYQGGCFGKLANVERGVTY